jgi:hypothetical protein
MRRQKSKFQKKERSKFKQVEILDLILLIKMIQVVENSKNSAVLPLADIKKIGPFSPCGQFVVELLSGLI